MCSLVVKVKKAFYKYAERNLRCSVKSGANNTTAGFVAAVSFTCKSRIVR
jgi:hypothetical protein